jgi:hypothetical protein
VATRRSQPAFAAHVDTGAGVSAAASVTEGSANRTMATSHAARGDIRCMAFSPEDAARAVTIAAHNQHSQRAAECM